MTSIGSTVAPASTRPRPWAGLGFVAPFLAVFALVFVAPIVYSLYLSLYRNRLIGGVRTRWTERP